MLVRACVRAGDCGTLYLNVLEVTNTVIVKEFMLQIAFSYCLNLLEYGYMASYSTIRRFKFLLP